jgi:hypothetical protein
MKRAVILAAIMAILLALPSIHAKEDCKLSFNAKSTDQLVKDIPSIDAYLQTCPVQIKSPLSTILKNGNTLFSISDDIKITATIKDGFLTSVKVGEVGKIDYIVLIDKCRLDAILSHDNRLGAFANYYSNKQVKVNANSFFGKIKLFFMKPLLWFGMKSARTDVTDSCGGTETTTEYPRYKVCEFYQAPKVTKKLVTCSAYKAGDTFCATSMGTADAKSLKCDNDGIVICAVPCSKKAPSRCAADINRPRGNNAPPLDYCPKTTTTTTTSGSGKPSNCYEANMYGASEYQFAKAEWDRRLAETGHICQTQTAEMPKGGKCEYTYQQIAGGDSKWLCWYK